MKKQKKRLVLFVMLITMLALSVSAQAKTSAKTINAVNKVVKTYFNAQKKGKLATMDKCLYKPRLGSYGSTYIDKFLKKYNKKLTYKITSTRVSGKNATVKVKCTYQSAYNLYMNSIFDLALKQPEALENSLSTTVALSSYMKTNLKAYPPKSKTTTLTIKLVKKSGTWKIKTLSKSMQNVLFLDLYQVSDDISSYLG